MGTSNSCLNLSYQNARSPNIEQILTFHDWLMVLILSIRSATLWAIFKVGRRQWLYRSLTESQRVEIAWTLIPTVSLLMIGLPSLRLLYLFDVDSNPSVMIKALGNQWYWQYDYADSSSYDSYLKRREYRLLDSDNRVIVPCSIPVQILITAADVLHSWTVPTMGVKADAVPGRINKVTMVPSRPGAYYGQCSEICGSNHRFMPISMECHIFNRKFYFESRK